ncbi:MAG: hypothetical protein PVG53_14425 [Holophagae bacterium]|jgi:hypothetical protein
MDPKHVKLIILLVVAAAGALWLRHFLSPAQAVKRQLAEAVAAVENEAIVGVMPKISRSYNDAWGGSYESLGGHLQSLMDAYDELDVDLAVDSVEVAGDVVHVAVTFVVNGTAEGVGGTVLGTRFEPCRATLRWHKEQPGWRLAETEELDIPELRDELERRRKP